MCCLIQVAKSFELPHRQACSLHTMQAGVLRVTTGRVWVTTDQMREDYFLHAGELLAIDAGVHVVIEAWNQNKSGLALLDWLEDAPTN